MKAKGYTRKEDVETVYANHEDEISELLLKLVIVHLREPLPQRFVVDEDEYAITAARKPWVYGKRIFILSWGEERILPCQDKWRFTFELHNANGR
ncbi:hypothetical protein PHLGIDRAFT_19469 [Phlebiopsis gigantea 11061_1 CR5-6]|uniref:Uncharacterized protein n=1 Tax=Phlebiopsis gigantea (strain 11061_1 CR5-6) TaxID=745531 RepID=A0A0C3PJK0_PHLG1|nr:hypothetical protein PHLGIDRAFT_19469 [Phlebiopsis gigantea 11061_1 CR5-6]